MTAHDNYRTGTDRAGSDNGDKLARLLATVVGATFLLVGVMGFIPGVTTNYDTMQFAGHEGEAQLLGLFEVSILHNLVHLLYGLAGLAMGRKARTAVTYLLGGGALYLVLWIYGLLIDQSSDANFVPLSDANNWLHLFLGVGMIGLGMVAKKALDRRDTTV